MEFYAFLRMDDAGELYWNDQFLFSCDDASGLATNREAMWQETTAHLQSGAFETRRSIDTLIPLLDEDGGGSFPGCGEDQGDAGAAKTGTDDAAADDDADAGGDAAADRRLSHGKQE